MMKETLDINTWARKEHFEFFGSFDDPFFGLTVNVDFTTVYTNSKESNSSFFLYSLHKIMQAVNDTEEFRYRINDESGVDCYHTIHAAPTVGRDNGTFGFSFFEYNADRCLFIKNAEQAIDKVKNSTSLFCEESERIDVIHYSSVPWIQFTEMKHPTSFHSNFSVPKISTGKLFKEGESVKLPVSITVNHALMDGLHVAQFIERLNEYIISDEI